MNSRKITLLAFLLLVAAGISSSLHAQQKTVHLKVVSNGKSTDSVYTVTYQGGSGSNSSQNFVTVYNNSKSKISGDGDDSIIEVNVMTSDNAGEDYDGDRNLVMIGRSRGGEAELDETTGDDQVISSRSFCTCMPNCGKTDSTSRKEMRKRIYMHMDANGQHGGKHRSMKYVISDNDGPSEDFEAQMEQIPLTAKDTTITHISPKGDTIRIHRKISKDGKIEQEVTVNKHSMDTANAGFMTYEVRPGRNRMSYRNIYRGHGEENFDFMAPPMSRMHHDADVDQNMSEMPEGIDENADFGKIKVTPLMGKNMVRISLELSGKETTVIKIKDESGKALFEEKVKDLTGKYVRDIDMGSNAKGKYSLGIDRGKSSLSKLFTY